ncbi:hypothetical protein N7455_007284 [Penicillium solitum]|uniref:uncharacterized protein n=1 Tax=Penicillium solitum TaxID=60172 RepID=UPI0017DFAF3D|nr:hypothetical protein HAV15_013216 [Penicillium sp. str. \
MIGNDRCAAISSRLSPRENSTLWEGRGHTHAGSSTSLGQRNWAESTSPLGSRDEEAEKKKKKKKKKKNNKITLRDKQQCPSH